MMHLIEAVKWGVMKLEVATQKREFWGQIWGQKRFWGQFGGSKKALYVR